MSRLGVPMGIGGGVGLGRGLGMLIDYPRQAVAGALMGLGGPVPGPQQPYDQAWPEREDLPASRGGMAGILPALLGLGAGGVAALTGVGAPLAVPIGAAVGGLAQAALNAYDPNTFANFSTDEVLQRAGLPTDPVTSTLAGMAMDPLTYAGGFGGARVMRGAAPGSAVAQGRLGKFITQADDMYRPGQALSGVGGGTVGVGTPAPPAMLGLPSGVGVPPVPMQSTPIAGMIDDLAARTAPRNARWAEQSARFDAMRPQPAVPSSPLAQELGMLDDTMRGTPGGRPIYPDVTGGNLQSMMGYRPEVMASVPDLDQLAILQNQGYKLQSPEIADALRAMGWQGGARGALPPWAQMRGGRVMPAGPPGQMGFDPFDPSSWLREAY